MRTLLLRILLGYNIRGIILTYDTTVDSYLHDLLSEDYHFLFLCVTFISSLSVKDEGTIYPKTNPFLLTKTDCLNILNAITHPPTHSV